MPMTVCQPLIPAGEFLLYGYADTLGGYAQSYGKAGQAGKKPGTKSNPITRGRTAIVRLKWLEVDPPSGICPYTRSQQTGPPQFR
jgi:hypothetical protein